MAVAETLNPKEVADLEGIAERTVRERCARGDYPGAYQHRAGCSWHIPAEIFKRAKSAESAESDKSGS